MKRWEGSGAVRAQQGSRLKSYLNLEMLFGFTVEVSYQLQFLFECLASFCGSKQEQQERKKERKKAVDSDWTGLTDYRSLKVKDSILQRDQLMIHCISSDPRSAPSSSSFVHTHRQTVRSVQMMRTEYVRRWSLVKDRHGRAIFWFNQKASNKSLFGFCFRHFLLLFFFTWLISPRKWMQEPVGSVRSVFSSCAFTCLCPCVHVCM